jgi:hypothetical protein
MPSSSKLCQIGLLSAFALAVAAAPAFAQDADAKAKKTTQQKKAEKPKSNSAMDKDTTSNYPPQQIPGSGY